MNHHKTALLTFNTFSVPCQAQNFYEVTSENELPLLTTLFPEQINKGDFYLLGEGSNTLFINDSVELVIKTKLTGISYQETEQDYFVSASAGENWHQFVISCIAKGIYGLENLALIPGSVGASPVQNIGAYGVELADFCYQVHWFDFTTNKLQIMTTQQCLCGYRDSIFKNELKNKGLITKVVFKFPKYWQAKIEYQGLVDLSLPITPEKIMAKVIQLRTEKLPDPNILPNAGSFFKNPIVTLEQFTALKNEYLNMPFYPQADGSVKLAAGWLIEQVGLKGKQLEKVAVHDKQALVLINNNNGTGQDVIQLARLIRATVFAKFSLYLTPEVRFIGLHGECDAVEVLDNV